MEACPLNRCVYLSKSRQTRRGKKRFLTIIQKFQVLVSLKKLVTREKPMSKLFFSIKACYLSIYLSILYIYMLTT